VTTDASNINLLQALNLKLKKLFRFEDDEDSDAEE